MLHRITACARLREISRLQLPLEFNIFWEIIIRLDGNITPIIISQVNIILYYYYIIYAFLSRRKR